MKKRAFLIPSLIAAGFSADKASALPGYQDVSQHSNQPPILERLKLKHLYTLAGHRSHSSHSSHRSHRSSSGGGYLPRYTPPSTLFSLPSTNRNQNSAPPSQVLPSSPSAKTKTLPGNSQKFRDIVIQVQAALNAYGYYTGAIDGIIGPESKTALSKMQRDYGLQVTGTVTPEVLNALGIVAQ